MGKDSSSQGWPVLRNSKQLTSKCTFQMQTNLSKACNRKLAPLSSFDTPDQHSPALITAGQAPDISGQPLHLRAHWNYSDQLILSLLTLPCSCLPMETQKSSHPHFLLTPFASWLTLVLPHVALWHVAWPLLLETVSNKLFSMAAFSWSVDLTITGKQQNLHLKTKLS